MERVTTACRIWDVRFETTDRSGAFVGAPGPSGVLQTYCLHQLRGVARLADF